ncbi:MAG: alkaline phosphatase family protein [Candidatus Sumerlaeia bacterium]|nr:alkaline phosphatase family protein [Candidatus Sumerlaeia bacterium]
MTESRDQRRLLVIGIDGGTFDLLDPLMRRGVMPNLAAVVARGFRATLRSTIPPNSAAAWATFVTGKNPGRHGVLRFQATRPTAEAGREFRPGAYTLLSSESIAGPRIWDILGHAGRRVAVINVPMTYPPRPLNGVMITGLLTPPEARDFTWPPELADSLPGYQIEQPLAAMGFSAEADRELVRASLDILRIQGETALRLLRQEPWDFFFVCFTGTDRLQHRLWGYLEELMEERKGDTGKKQNRSDLSDSSDLSDWSPLHDPSDLPDSKYFLRRLEHYYRLLDEAIGRLLAAAGGTVNCLILSDHGFGPAPERAVYRRVLARYLGLEAGEGVGGFHSVRAWLERRGILDGDRLRRLLAGTPLRRLLSRLSRFAVRKEHEAWRSSRAYLVVLHKYIGGVGINLPPDSPDYAPLCQSLIERLKAVCDPDTGDPIVTEVWRREEIYRGPRVPVCPDIIFRLDLRYGLSHGDSPGGRLVQPKTFRSRGIHRDEGILLAAGPDIVHGVGGKAPAIADVTATALYLLDAAIPSDMDGTVVADAISPAYRAEHPVRIEPASEEPVSPDMAGARWRSARDEDAVAEQLRDLGYLD